MTLTNLKRRDVKGLMFRRISGRTVRPTAIIFGMLTHVGKGVLLVGQSRPHPKVEARPQRTHFTWDFPDFANIV